VHHDSTDTMARLNSCRPFRMLEFES
jgi:hypothetical protein